jgi:hypothetical protein
MSVAITNCALSARGIEISHHKPSKKSSKPSIETFKYIIKFAERNTSGQMIISKS